MNLEQIMELQSRVALKTIPMHTWLPNTLIWRSRKILDRLTAMERELRIKEGRYCNGL